MTDAHHGKRIVQIVHVTPRVRPARTSKDLRASGASPITPNLA
ncbi:uncharacterized protein CPUR_08804 [Claviceps purpurea 20.1]|uniref:Uncharacterized protein n=1 Tax=Claviceps purpurea (strain 20.1) TaxID=1111077 RepID=M1WDK8_CLAP2|nr:uncharacterized protein CPUR_08804 [Claviceps purpurea 20.1]